MSDALPHSRSSTDPRDRAQVKRVVEERGLAGLANDTKWDEFIDAVRAHESWRPSYRYKCVDGPVSGWDVEWFYHLPFPLISVEWFDIVFLQHEHRHRLTPPVVTDHSSWLEDALNRAGLDHRKGNSMLRVFGYAPRNLEYFDE